MRVVLVIILTLSLADIIASARILGVFYFPSYSHFVLGETQFKELAARGHEVTVVSTHPQKEKLKNYNDVAITSTEYFMNETRSIGEMVNIPKVAVPVFVYMIGNELTDLTLQDKNFQDLLNNNETYDAIILELFANKAQFGLMHHFKAPLIAFLTSSSSFWSNRLDGNPSSYASISNFFLSLPPRMNLWQRTCNSIFSIFEYMLYYIWILPNQDKILHKHFPNAPPLSNLMQNVSLVFVNSHPAIGSAIPLLPNIIEIGGFHVQGQNKKGLSDDLQRYLDEAKDGVIYFSMGSHLKSKDIDKDKLQYLVNTFAKLKMRILWKWEDDYLPGKPENVRIEKWLPQSAVLSHENVKIFITHGGKLSTIESIYYAKPILGIPIFGDQELNIEQAVYHGYGLHIPYQVLSEDKLTDALTELIKNPKYAQEAKYRSSALRSLNVSPLENAVQWVEYVIKHKGVPHLKNSAMNTPMYQYLLLDVLFVSLVGIWILKKLVLMVFRKLFRRNSSTKKQKIN